MAETERFSIDSQPCTSPLTHLHTSPPSLYGHPPGYRVYIAVRGSSGGNMKTNWKKIAASLALLFGISGVAFGQDRNAYRDNDHRDNDNRARVVTQYRDHDRDDRGWNNSRFSDRDDRRADNNQWYGNHYRTDGDRHDYTNSYRNGYGR